MTGQLPIPGLEPEPEITGTVTSEVFYWFDNEEDVIVQRQPAIAVYIATEQALRRVIEAPQHQLKE
jgi:hypothetical protein